jgi:hypothetical protein
VKPDNVTPHPDALFDPAWLALRSRADSAARSDDLSRRAHDWLSRRRTPGETLQLVDLGTGSGANPRHLAPRLPGPQHWRLIDHDDALLALARDACAGLHDADGEPVCVDTFGCDLRAPEAMRFGDADLVCATALFDLVDAHWLNIFAAACAQARCAALITLSVDGEWHFAGCADDADDAFVRNAFNAHQRRNKGSGPALGASAVPRLAALFESHGHAVTLAASPWQLSGRKPWQAALAAALMDGWRDAATEQCPDDAARIAAWHARRQAVLLQVSWSLQVGHLDLFATPPEAVT